MQVGIQLPEVERMVRWPELAAMARAAEESGFDSVWLGDHLLYRDDRRERGPWDVWTQLAALAATTHRVTLGPLVAATPFHAPGMLARMAVSVDEISGGRLMLGVGAGWNEVEFRAFGFPLDQSVSRFEEAFTIVRRLLASERVTFAGRFYEIADAIVLPAPARRIPIMVGSNGTRMLRITLPHVDAWNTWYREYENSVAGFAALNRTVDDACRAVGRDVRTLRRSACVLAVVDRGSGERRHDTTPVAVTALAEHVRDLASAGADEAILVLDPITEGSIRTAGRALAALRERSPYHTEGRASWNRSS